MKVDIIRIGNSQGLRIPKPILKQVGFSREVELEVKEDHLIIRRAHAPRVGWHERFAKMNASDKDDTFEDVNLSTAWDENEWEW